MGKRAARVGDMHTCPKLEPGTGTPHVGGVIKEPGCGTVLINGMPAATVGDKCACVCAGEPNSITKGSNSVFISGKAAARVGDGTAHGGKVTDGSKNVFIGERWDDMLTQTQKALFDEEVVWPSQEEKNEIINTAVKNCIILLESKLQLLEKRDRKTLEDFNKWFGCDDESAMQLILNRVVRILEFAKGLTVDYFGVIENDHERMQYFATVHPSDEFREIRLGDKFWKTGNVQDKMQVLTLIHELSHFEGIGNTKDFDYGIKQCRYLARNSPSLALYNAANFEYFIDS